MVRRLSLLVVIGFSTSLASVTLTLAGPGPGPSAKQERPNILFVLTDDMRWDDAGAFGNPNVRTPNVNELAVEGKTFNRTIVSAPVCHPSRSSYLSGLYPHQDGIEDLFIGNRLKDNTPTVASELNKTGYTTGFIGKAHPNGTPHDWHFQEVPTYSLTNAIQPDTGSQGRIFQEADGETVLVRRDSTEYLVDHGINFFKQHQEDPWFLWFATNAPHGPYFFSDNHPYTNSELERPPGFPDSEAFPNIIPAVEDKLGITIPDPFRERFRNLWRNYYSLTSTMDQQLGRLFRALEKTGQAENTVVVFTSDHGIMNGSHGIPFKSIWYDESTRVSTVVRWPDHVASGTETDSLISNVDFIHTFVDLAGGNTRDLESEGRSFLPLMLDQRKRTRGFVFSESKRVSELGGGRWNMLRGDRFKYVRILDSEEQYLFDLKKDPHEKNNLIDQVPPGIEKTLQTMVKTFRESDTKGRMLGPNRTGEANVPSPAEGQCLIQRAAPRPLSKGLRALRDWMLKSDVGRMLTATYYRFI